jgi:hypothetical protein
MSTDDQPHIPVHPDVDATKSLYAAFEPYRCDCAYCRNLRLQWTAFVTGAVIPLLKAYGIDPQKPLEIIDFGRVEGGGRTCEIEWPFLVKLPAPSITHSILQSTDNAEIWLGCGGIPCPTFDVTERRWSLRIMRKHVSWLLNEPEPN